MPTLQDGITLKLDTLHWLPVKDGIDHKILSLAYSCFSCTAPQRKKLIPLYLPPLSLWSSSQSRLCIASVKETIPKSSLAEGFLQLCPQTLEGPPSGTERIWVFFSFSQETQRTRFQTSDCPFFHFFLFFSVCGSHCLLSGKETAQVCTTNMFFSWMFEHSTDYQSSSSSAVSHKFYWPTDPQQQVLQMPLSLYFKPGHLRLLVKWKWQGFFHCYSWSVRFAGQMKTADQSLYTILTSKFAILQDNFPRPSFCSPFMKMLMANENCKQCMYDL